MSSDSKYWYRTHSKRINSNPNLHISRKLFSSRITMSELFCCYIVNCVRIQICNKKSHQCVQL